MSERMTNESLEYHRRKVEVEDGIYSYDAMQAELDRARASEKALADALRKEMDALGGHLGLCPNGEDDDDGCAPRCRAMRATLEQLP